MTASESQSLARILNELLILATIRDGPRHGYQIALDIETRSEGYFTFNHGTLYPILHHLEKQGYVDGDWDDGRGPRRRKQYSLTGKGEEYFQERLRGWGELNENLAALLPAAAPLRPRAASDRG